MLYGIIDLGSNTIRLSIYKWEQGNITLLLHKKTMAGLIGFVKNGVMSEKGIRRACQVLSLYKHVLSNFEMDKVYVFATASLRNIANTLEALEAIQQSVGIQVDVLSGEEEAALDFQGAVYDADLKDGILIDIGGGSTELVPFESGKMVQAYSIPMGSLSMYRKHVKKLLPKEKECAEIQKAVEAELDSISFLKGKRFPVICGVGGSIRATAKLYNDIFDKDPENHEMQADDVRAVLKELDGTGKETYNKILEVVPDRIHTIKPGMLILDTVMRLFDSKRLLVSRCGVREGYLLKKAAEK